jgi:hypothetical protein
MSDREKILELITKTMNEYDYREPSEEYASHEMLLLISRIKELPAAEEVEGWAIYHDGIRQQFLRLHRNWVILRAAGIQSKFVKSPFAHWRTNDRNTESQVNG